MIRRLLIVAITWWANAAQAFTGVVSHITDGDTIWVRPEGTQRKPVKVRLQGIDAPEGCQAGGAQATAALKSRLLHQSQTVAKDTYHRTLGHVRLHGEDIAAWMVSQGQAWSAHGRVGNLGPYGAQERQARAARRGVFASREVMEPRAFRKMHGSCK
jgi:micrococcal nuclease